MSESDIERLGMLVGNLEKNPLEVPRSCFNGLKCFVPLRARGTNNLKTILFLLSHVLSSCCGSTKTTYLTPKRYDKHHAPLFKREYSLGGTAFTTIVTELENAPSMNE